MFWFDGAKIKKNYELRITNYDNFGENQIIKERNNHNLSKKILSPAGESILSDKSCEGHAASRAKCRKKGGECGDNHLHRQLNQSLLVHRKLISFSWLEPNPSLKEFTEKVHYVNCINS